MILVDIIQNNDDRAIEISKYLISNKYALQTNIDTNKIINSDVEFKTVRLFFVTKALLFDVIEKEIKDVYGETDILIYATPISHVSKEFGELLRLKLKAV
jgi:hypothetical protein